MRWSAQHHSERRGHGRALAFGLAAVLLQIPLLPVQAGAAWVLALLTTAATVFSPHCGEGDTIPPRVVGAARV